MAHNDSYHVNIYYTEEEVHHAFKNYFEDIRQHSKVHIFTSDPLPLSFYGEDENVELHAPGGLWEKLKAWIAGEERFQKEFSALNISEADRENYRTIIQNGGTIVVTTQDNQIDELFVDSHPTEEDAIMSTSDQYITGENDPLLGETESLTTPFANLTDQPTYDTSSNDLGNVHAAHVADTEKKSYNTLPDEALDAEPSVLSHLDHAAEADTNDLVDDFEATPEGTFSKGFTPANLHAETITNEEQLATSSFTTDELQTKTTTDETLEPFNYSYGEVQDTHIASPTEDDVQRGKQTFLSNVDSSGDTNSTYQFNDIQSTSHVVPDENILSSEPLEVEPTPQFVSDDIPIASDGYNADTNRESFPRIPDEAAEHPGSELSHLETTDASPQIYSDGYSIHQTESTFDVISNRNSGADPKNEQLQHDLREKLDEQAAEHKQPFTFDLQDEPTTFTLEEEATDVEGLDTAHRPDLLEDEAFNEMSKEHPLNDIRNETLGNAAENRRHDLP